MTRSSIPSPRRAICIAQPKIGVLTETFIDAHYRHLQSPVFRLECDPFPVQSEDGRPLFSLGLPIFHRLVGRLFGFDTVRADRALFCRLPRGIQDSLLARHLRQNDTGVVLAEYGPTGVTMSEACRESDIPLVVHFHGYDAYKRSVLSTLKTEYRQLFAEAAAVIGVSKHMCSQLISLGAPAEKVVYNPYGIDVEAFLGARPELNPPTFLAVGRFVEKKAPQLTIQAFARLAESRPDARLILVGDGPLLSNCIELSTRLGIDRQIEMAGSMPHHQVALIMSKVRCFVQHSITPPSGDMEGTPLAILEAMASGLPVVTTRHGGIMDVVTEGKNGILVNEGDVNAMADGMARFADSPIMAAQFGESARTFASLHHSHESRIAQLESILIDAIIGKPPLSWRSN